MPPHDAARLRRETLIYENAGMALAHVARVTRIPISQWDAAFTGSPSGLADMPAADPVIAMGMLPHRLLADFQKRTLLAGDPDLQDPDEVHDIAQLIWSCANTSRAVAIGQAAWHALQLLPVGERLFYPVPPLKLPPGWGEIEARRLFVINHGNDDELAEELAERASREGFTVVCSGMSPEMNPFCCPEAAIHIHLGHHSVADNHFRLIDSWHSGRLAVQCIAQNVTETDAETLLVEDAVNGLVCDSADTALAMCREMEQDHVLCRKFIGAGHCSAAPAARAWPAIAADLLR